MEKRDNTKFRKKQREKFDIKKKFVDRKKKQAVIENQKIKELKQSYQEIDPCKIEKFADFPLGDKTAKALREANFTIPTKIQKEAIGFALQGRDVLGAAKTGSGKTLAFLIPVLEHLYCEKWSPADGLGALIISPTRELAYQIFEVLRKIGRYHDFSAGLVIGGKHVREEADRINRTNIVICTPGRLLQHMDETAYFHADYLKLLVLDEADRILDLGFQQTMNAIIQNLPSERQTLLFSATQTKSVKDLARLSLKNPVYVSVHEHAQHSTPTQLVQSYLVCDLEQKVNLIWSFVKHHLKAKVLVFLASCKQVRFIYEVFRRMRPGVTVLSLHGAMQQMKRMAVYESFCRKQFAVLFATDVAARGLDFPAINWVIQLDCPEDAKTYIHRVGRTARYEEDGEALLVLLPSEEKAMISELESKRIPINKIKVNPNRQRDIHPKMASMLAADIELKGFAQRAFVSYLKSVFFMSNKKIFDVTQLDIEAFARSLGLALTPRVRFIEKEKRRLQNKTDATSDMNSGSLKETFRNDATSVTSSESEQSSGDETSSQDGSSSEYSSATEDGATERQKLKEKDCDFDEEVDDDDDDDGLFKVKCSFHSLGDFNEKEESIESITDGRNKMKITTKYAKAKKLLKKKLKVNSKIEFDEDGKEIQDVCRKPQVMLLDDDDDDDGDTEAGINIIKAKRRLAEEDKFDKKLYQKRVKEKHREKRLKEKEKQRKPTHEEEVGIKLVGSDEASDLEQQAEADSSEDERSSGSEHGVEWDSADYSDFSEPSPPLKKKKRFHPSVTSDEDDGEGLNIATETGHSLADDEILALKLLQNS